MPIKFVENKIFLFSTNKAFNATNVMACFIFQLHYEWNISGNCLFYRGRVQYVETILGYNFTRWTKRFLPVTVFRSAHLGKSVTNVLTQFRVHILFLSILIVRFFYFSYWVDLKREKGSNRGKIVVKNFLSFISLWITLLWNLKSEFSVIVLEV